MGRPSTLWQRHAPTLVLLTIVSACHPTAEHPEGRGTRRSSIEELITECYERGCDEVLERHGFERIDGAACPAAACMGVDRGGMVRGARYRFVGHDAVLLFRGYHDPLARMGHWWALERPRGTGARYRARFAICPEWNSLTEVVECPLRRGAEIVIGPGQSAECHGGVRFDASPVLQAFVVDAKQAFDVDACLSRPW